jgi:hypothetical protein
LPIAVFLRLSQIYADLDFLLRMRQFFFAICFLFQTLNIFSQTPQNVPVYDAGYKTIILKDPGRIYKPNTPITDSLHFRPLEIDVWYPAVAQKADVDPMKYVEFVKLLEERANRFQNDTVYHNLTSELLNYIGANLQITDTSKLKQLKTNSFRDAMPVQKRFPLIIYQCSYNGMSFENVPLFEKLATNGFVVAVITSVGRYPGNMTTEPEDLIEQTEDGLFALHHLTTASSIDPTKIGVMGYSWGGPASLLMAMKDQCIKAIISFDGSEMHYYRDSAKENNDFNQLRKSAYFHPEHVHAPYAYLESGHKQDDEPADSIYNIFPSLQGERKYIRFTEATHEDFSVIRSLALDVSKNQIKNSGFYDTVITCTINFFDQYLNWNRDLFTKTINALYQVKNSNSHYPVPPANKKNNTALNGMVIDAQTKQPIAYVNLGIPNKNLGTVSRLDGSFQLAADLNDTIEVSMIAYESKKYLCSSDKKTNSGWVIELKPKPNSLQEVVITAKTLPIRTLGNTTTSNFFKIGLPLRFLGSEIGIVIKPGKRPSLLKSFNFNISENHLDSAIFRLNIYSLKKGQPFENMLSENILLHIGNQPGPVHLDLSRYKIILKEDVLISLEWIDGGKSGTERGILFLSAGLLNTGTWHRLTSLAKWTKANGIGVGFNVQVQPGY